MAEAEPAENKKITAKNKTDIDFCLPAINCRIFLCPRQDSNLESSVPKTDMLSITPRGLTPHILTFYQIGWKKQVFKIR